MTIIYLITILVSMCLQNVLKKAYTDKNGNGVYFFSALACLAAAIFFALTSKNFCWDMKMVPYALAFALAYSFAIVAGVLAFHYGSFSLTNLIVSYSLVIPTFYGLIFLNETISLGFGVGILFLLASLVLINKKDENATFNWKWILCAVLAFLGNGFCSTFQRMQQEAFNGAYKNEFMIIALLVSTVVIGSCSVVKERKQVRTYLKNGWLLAISCGLFNGITNLFVMILSKYMSASIMYPLISAGGIVLAYLVSKLIYREELSKKQLIGYVLGTVSVIFLNI